MMARWTAAGSLDNLIGPLLLAGMIALGWGWRWAFIGLAGLVLCPVIGVLLARFLGEQDEDPNALAGSLSPKELLPNLWQAVRHPG